MAAGPSGAMTTSLREKSNRSPPQGERHIRLLAPLAFISPSIIAAIVDGTAPTALTVTGLAKALPYSWAEQERRTGVNSNNITSSKSGSAQRYEMPRMRLGMFYLAGYLLPVGLPLMFAPQLTMKLLLTSHTYDDLGLRMGGVFLFALGMIVTSMIIN